MAERSVLEEYLAGGHVDGTAFELARANRLTDVCNAVSVLHEHRSHGLDAGPATRQRPRLAAIGDWQTRRNRP